MSAEEIVKAIAKQLPVKAAYTDAVKPAAKQVGRLSEDVLKALRLALFPVTIAAGLHDRFEKFVKDAVARVLKRNASHLHLRLWDRFLRVFVTNQKGAQSIRCFLNS
jgi:hypothetical protein